MFVFADSINFARDYLPEATDWKPLTVDTAVGKFRGLFEAVFSDRQFHAAEINHQADFGIPPEFEYLLMVDKAARSHYDLLIDLCREGINLPSGLLLLTGSSDKLHGFRNRPWEALAGNIHLVAYFNPGCEIKNFGPGFMALAAVSAVQAIESVVELRGRAKIKWVNDILIDRAKVCGVLAYTQTEGLVVNNVVLGIGMNVEANPLIKTTPFVPETACLCDLVGDKKQCHPKNLFESLIENLARNYKWLKTGKFPEILNLYREYSCVIDQQVEVYPDTPEDSSGETRSGIVAGIGENLEIYLRGQSAPITRGRLVLKSFK